MRRRDDFEPIPNGDGAKKKGILANAKTWVAGGIAVYLVLFILVNNDKVDVNFVLGSAKEISLWLVMALCGILGFVIGWLLGRTKGVRRRRDRRD